MKAGQPWGKRRGTRRGALPRLAALLKPGQTRPQAGGRRLRPVTALSSSGRLYRRAKNTPAFSALLISLACLLVAGAFLSLLAIQVWPLALVLAVVVGWITWRSLKSEADSS